MRSSLNKKAEHSFKPQFPSKMKPMFSRLPAPPEHRRMTNSPSFEALKKKVDEFRKEVAIRFRNQQKSNRLNHAIDKLKMISRDMHEMKESSLLFSRGEILRKEVYRFEDEFKEVKGQIEEYSKNIFPQPRPNEFRRNQCRPNRNIVAH